MTDTSQNPERLNPQEAAEIIALLEHVRDKSLSELDVPNISPSAARKFLVLVDRMEAERESADYGTAVGQYIHLDGGAA